MRRHEALSYSIFYFPFVLKMKHYVILILIVSWLFLLVLNEPFKAVFISSGIHALIGLFVFVFEFDVSYVYVLNLNFFDIRCVFLPFYKKGVK